MQNHQSDKILVSTHTESSSSTTDIIRAANNIITPDIKIIRTICSLMNIDIDYHTICGDLGLFETEIVRLSIVSGVDMTIIPYETDRYSIIKNIINNSANRILLVTLGINKHHVFINTNISILVIITDNDLFEIIKKFEQYPHIRLYALFLIRTIDSKHIRWFHIIDTPVSRLEDLTNIINQSLFI